MVLTALLFGSGQAFSQSGNAREFGIGSPQRAQDLPRGLLRSKLESLPPQAHSRALQWLQSFSFPEADLQTLHIGDDGGVFYVDTLLPQPVDPEQEGSEPFPEGAPITTLDDVFLLHSRPGSSNVVFLDFDGDTIVNTAWNGEAQCGAFAQYDAVPFDIDGIPTTFNDTERERIGDIWHRMAEDLSPYDIDVTTEEPASFNSTIGHVLITDSTDDNGNAMPCSGGGGVAYVNVFGIDNYHTYYSPALVYADHLGPNGQTYIAEASSHEFGHNLGLSHDGATPNTTYYAGHGSGLVSWAPIMGNSYNKNVTQWSKGEYTNANNSQDDLAVIDGKLGFVTDDHGDLIGTATEFSLEADGSVLSTNPEIDPHNVYPVNKGIINSATDTDVFSFNAGAGLVTLTVNPAWDAWFRATDRRGANLDIEVELLDSVGASVDLDEPVDDTMATVTATVAAGTFYLAVTGVGNTITPYSDYGSLGEYFVFGSIPSANTDVTATTTTAAAPLVAPGEVAAAAPDAPTSLTATAISHAQINLSWVDNSSNETAFDIERSPDGSDWSTLTSVGAGVTAYSDTELLPMSTWFYQVRASNSEGNSAWSDTDSATTPDARGGGGDAPTSLTATTASTSRIDLGWTDNSSNEDGFEIERSPDGSSSWVLIGTVGVDDTSYSNTGLSESTTYYYRVKATATDGDSAYSNVASDTTYVSCSASKTFAGGQWYQFSLACNPSPDNKVSEVFPEMSVLVFSRDALNQIYTKLEAADVMSPGTGYFIKFASDTDYILSGYPNTSTDLELVSDFPSGRQNLIGHYGNGDVSWADVIVVDGQQTMTIAEADPWETGPNPTTHVCDLETPTNKCLVSRLLNIWNGGAYQVYDGETSGLIGTVSALTAIWVKAFKFGVELRIPAPAAAPAFEAAPDNGNDGGANQGKGKGKKDTPEPWFIRLIAESGELRDPGNVLGQLPDSNDGIDGHDLEEPAPFGSTYLSILFTNPLFEEVDWGYTSDFRSQTDTPYGEWPFVVKASSEFTEITLRWEGASGLFENAWLIDQQSGESIKVRAGESYRFDTDTGGNYFRFTLQ